MGVGWERFENSLPCHPLLGIDASSWTIHAVFYVLIHTFSPGRMIGRYFALYRLLLNYSYFSFNILSFHLNDYKSGHLRDFGIAVNVDLNPHT